jgi:hypothetical protein
MGGFLDFHEMAAATHLLATAGLCTAKLNYDSVTLLATGVTINNAAGSVAVAFFIVTSGVRQSGTVQPGASQTLTFPTARSVTIVNIGADIIAITGLTEFGVNT